MEAPAAYGAGRHYKMIYADNAATTRLCDASLEAMRPYFQEQYGNASALYRLGRQAHRALEDSRKAIALSLGAGPMEICFTSGGTEADNWAVKGTMRRLAREGKVHMITSMIEHSAILESARSLEKEGFEITYLPVGKSGVVSPEMVELSIRPDTGLVSIMYANNETGVIQPIKEIGRICRKHRVIFHTDAVQAVGVLPVNVREDNTDLLSLSAHKFGGPKGIGALYIKKGVLPDTFLDGGGQERGHRSGTENVAAVVGMAAALSHSVSCLEEKAERIRSIRDRVEKILSAMPGAHLNGAQSPRLPGITNISFEDTDGQSLLMDLDLSGVAASSGSACHSGSMAPSQVLLAMGVPYRLAHGSLRLSFGPDNREEEIIPLTEAVINALNCQRDGPSDNFQKVWLRTAGAGSNKGNKV